MPRGEHHRDPGDGLELRLLVVTAERDAPVLAGREPDDEEHEARRHEREEPAHVVHDPAEACARGRAEGVGAEETPQHERDGDDCRDTEDDGVDLLGFVGPVLRDHGVEGGVRVVGQVLEGVVLAGGFRRGCWAGLGQCRVHVGQAPFVGRAPLLRCSGVSCVSNTVSVGRPPFRERTMSSSRAIAALEAPSPNWLRTND